MSLSTGGKVALSLLSVGVVGGAAYLLTRSGAPLGAPSSGGGPKTPPPRDVKEIAMRWAVGANGKKGWYAVNAAGQLLEPVYHGPPPPVPGSAAANGAIQPFAAGTAPPAQAPKSSGTGGGPLAAIGAAASTGKSFACSLGSIACVPMAGGWTTTPGGGKKGKKHRRRKHRQPPCCCNVSSGGGGGPSGGGAPPGGGVCCGGGGVCCGSACCCCGGS